MRRSRRAGTGSGSRSTLALVVADVFGTTLVTERCRAVLLASGVTRVVGSTIILAFRANKPGDCILKLVHIRVGPAYTLTREVESARIAVVPENCPTQGVAAVLLCVAPIRLLEGGDLGWVDCEGRVRVGLSGDQRESRERQKRDSIGEHCRGDGLLSMMD